MEVAREPDDQNALARGAEAGVTAEDCDLDVVMPGRVVHGERT